MEQRACEGLCKGSNLFFRCFLICFPCFAVFSLIQWRVDAGLRSTLPRLLCTAYLLNRFVEVLFFTLCRCISIHFLLYVYPWLALSSNHNYVLFLIHYNFQCFYPVLPLQISSLWDSEWLERFTWLPSVLTICSRYVIVISFRLHFPATRCMGVGLGREWCWGHVPTDIGWVFHPCWIY